MNAGDITISTGAMSSGSNITLSASGGQVVVYGNVVAGGSTGMYANTGVISAMALTTGKYQLVNGYVFSSALSGVYPFYLYDNGQDQYTTTAATGNITLNLRYMVISAATTIDSKMATGQNMTLTLTITTGATPYGVTAFTLDSTGTSVPISWAGGSQPTFVASATLEFKFKIMKTGSGTFKVLGSMTRY